MAFNAARKKSTYFPFAISKYFLTEHTSVTDGFISSLSSSLFILGGTTIQKYYQCQRPLNKCHKDFTQNFNELRQVIHHHSLLNPSKVEDVTDEDRR